MVKKTIAFHTLGCKLNFSETSTISRGLSTESYEVTDFKEIADIYVIHSCAVTAAAEKKCRQVIRQAKKRNPEAKVVVMGCFPQLNPDELSEMKEIDLLLGSKDKFDIQNHLEKLDQLQSKKVVSDNILKEKEFTPSYSISGRTRSFLKIQDGCDYFCTFCTIPYARGTSRSGTIPEIVDAAQEIAQAGIREIILTGVNIGDFGKNHDVKFIDLIKELNRVEGIERIRISSIEPDLLTDEIIEFVAASDKFMPHFHIPLQAGSNKILKAMKRKYRREVFTSRVHKIKELMPDCCIAADVIVGFPDETDDDFMDSYNFINSCDISYIHVFTYSERPGTPAAKMTGKVPAAVKKERSKILHDLSHQKKKIFYQNNRNRVSLVLFEHDIHKDHIFGFTDNYIRVKTHFRQELINKIVSLRLQKFDEEGEAYLFADCPSTSLRMTF